MHGVRRRVACVCAMHVSEHVPSSSSLSLGDGDCGSTHRRGAEKILSHLRNDTVLHSNLPADDMAAVSTGKMWHEPRMLLMLIIMCLCADDGGARIVCGQHHGWIEWSVVSARTDSFGETVETDTGEEERERT